MSVYGEVYKIVKKIPRGRVLTYGLISDMLEKRLSAQGVGWAMRALPGPTKKGKPPDGKIGKPAFDSKSVPWHRVVNSFGGISTSKNPNMPPDLQKNLLESEGIEFDSEDKLNLSKHLWLEGIRKIAKRRS